MCRSERPTGRRPGCWCLAGVGAYSVKWLERIDVSAQWVPSWRADEYYVHRDIDGQAVGPVTAHPVKSQLALPWPAPLPPGRHTLKGYARSGHAPVEQVEWRLDDGDWAEVRLRPLDLGRWAWTPFEIDIDLGPGEHTIRTPRHRQRRQPPARSPGPPS